MNRKYKCGKCDEKESWLVKNWWVEPLWQSTTSQTNFVEMFSLKITRYRTIYVRKSLKIMRIINFTGKIQKQGFRFWQLEFLLIIILFLRLLKTVLKNLPKELVKSVTVFLTQ